MGSEMCIRDRLAAVPRPASVARLLTTPSPGRIQLVGIEIAGSGCCLLYTSDAADERSSVDLGGRRIIKKKTITNTNKQRDLLNDILTRDTISTRHRHECL